MPHCNYHLLDWVSEGKMKEKRILLTTLGSTGNNRFDYKYFYYDRNGWFNYCNSLSIAEAGTKYILSKENIDEIIVLGSGATYNNEDVLRPLVLRNFADYSAEGIENLSEYFDYSHHSTKISNELMEAMARGENRVWTREDMEKGNEVIRLAVNRFIDKYEPKH
jgi:hypothetical protein